MTTRLPRACVRASPGRRGGRRRRLRAPARGRAARARPVRGDGARTRCHGCASAAMSIPRATVGPGSDESVRRGARGRETLSGPLAHHHGARTPPPADAVTPTPHLNSGRPAAGVAGSGGRERKALFSATAWPGVSPSPSPGPRLLLRTLLRVRVLPSRPSTAGDLRIASCAPRLRWTHRGGSIFVDLDDVAAGI